jgi:flagellar protein FliO/FliZ
LDRLAFAAAAHDAASAAQNAAPAAEEGAKLGQTAFSMAGYIQAIGILFLILALLWGVVWLMRRYGRFNFLPRPGALPRDALVMEAQMPLGPRKGLMVVRFLNKRLLLGVTDRQITLLTEEKACHEPHGANFKHIMEQIENGGPDCGDPDRGRFSAGN